MIKFLVEIDYRPMPARLALEVWWKTDVQI